MNPSDPYVLSSGVRLVPVRDLPSIVRGRFIGMDEHVVLTRPRSRTTGKLLDPAAAALVREFLEPTTVVDAVIRCGARLGIQPERVLEGAFPLVADLASAGILVRFGAPELASPGRGRRLAVGGYDVHGTLRLLEDTEVYEVQSPDGTPAVLKLATDRDGWAHLALQQEARVLEFLNGPPAPRLVEAQLDWDPPFLLMEWCPGISVDRAADELNRPWATGSRDRALDLCCRVLDAYGALHDRGVLHGDVQPGNVLVDRSGAVRVVDFGFARLRNDRSPAVGRGGVGIYFDPEHAAALRRGRQPPPLEPPAEQYSLGALCYRLLTGRHHLIQEVEEERFLERIVADPPLPFIHHAVPPWPPVESALARALAKDPPDRFPSVGTLAQTLRQAVRRHPGGERRREPLGLLPVLLESFARSECIAASLPAPAASVNFGAAGVAYLFYRAALALGRADLLATADVWIDRARAVSSDGSAVYAPDIGITAESVGRASLHHGIGGIHCVEGLIALARGMDLLAGEAVHAYIEAAHVPRSDQDVATGTAGMLLGCTLLLEASSRHALDQAGLVTLACSLVDELWLSATMTGDARAFDGHGDGRRTGAATGGSLGGEGREADTGPEGEGTAVGRGRAAPGESFLGIAHGWAGLLYASLRWSVASGDPLPPAGAERLGELADLARWDSQRARWPRVRGGDEYWVGWCHGSAGHAHLWCAAHSLSGQDEHLDLARAAAEDAWVRRSSVGDLCCGLAGQAYAMLAVYRATGEGRWVDRARALGAQARAQVGGPLLRPGSLYRGDVGVAALEADLLQPEFAAMPLFASEGWPCGP
jgi:hypothetical protein